MSQATLNSVQTYVKRAVAGIVVAILALVATYIAREETAKDLRAERRAEICRRVEDSFVAYTEVVVDYFNERGAPPPSAEDLAAFNAAIHDKLSTCS
jgi:hypothetical protein